MPPSAVDQVDAIGRTNAVLAKYGGAPVGPITHGAVGTRVDNTPAPKSNFWNAPGQVGGILLNAGRGIVSSAVSPFVHIGNDLLTSARVGAASRNQDIQQNQLMDQMRSLKQQHAAGGIDTPTYQKGLQDISDKLRGMSADIGKIEAPIKNETLGSIAGDVAGAAGTVLTLGAGGLESGAVKFAAEKAAAKLAATEAGNVGSIGTRMALAGNAARRIVPAAVEQTVGAGETFGKSLVTQGAGKLVRNAIVTQPTIQQTGELGQNIHDGHYQQAAVNAGLLLGVPALAGLAPQAMKLAGKVGQSVFGKSSFLDSIPTSTGQTITDYLKSGKATDAEQQTAKVMQQYNLSQAGAKDASLATHEQHTNAAQFYNSWLNGVGSETMSPSQHIQAFQDMTDAVNKVRSDALAGKLLKPDGTNYSAAEVKNLWVGRFSTTDRTAINNQLDQAGSAAARVQAVKDMTAADNRNAPAWSRNTNLVAQMEKAAAADNYRGEVNALDPTKDIRDMAKNTFVADTPNTGIKDGAQAFDEALGIPHEPTAMKLAEPKPGTTPSFAGEKPMPKLPTELQGAKPNYNYGSKAFSLKFGDDVTKALYVVANGGKSASHDNYMQFIRDATGKTDEQIGAMAKDVRDGVKAQAKDSEPGTLSVASHSDVAGQPTSLADRRAAYDAAQAPAVQAPVGDVAAAAAADPLSKPQDYGQYVPIRRAQGTEIPLAKDSGPVIEGTKGTAIGSWLTKNGLSPYATPAGAISQSVKNTMVSAFDQHADPALKGQGEAIYSKLMTATTGENSVYDPRMLNHQQVLNALGSNATNESATAAMTALREAYAKVPAELVGAGGKLTNAAMKDIPFMNQYMKVQGLAKFSANPFFYLKQLSKSGIVAVLKGADHFSMSSETEQFLRGKQVFSKLGNQDAGVGDAMGTELSGLGQAGGNDMKGPIKNIVGGLAESMANAHGMTVKELWNHPELGPEMEHALRVVTGYPKGGYINSPLAKTLNVAIFPSRFETKVLQVVGHAFAEQPPVVQAALATGINNMSGYLKSNEGQQWQKDNSESLGLLKYFTPISTIDNVNNFLSKDHGGHIADLGSIGGLPFGVITTILQHQGILGEGNTLKSSPYADPKTGKIVPEKVPATAWGHAQQALIDLVGSTFSFPGKQAGFTISKTNLVTSAPGLKQNAADYKSLQPNESVAPSTSPASGNISPAIKFEATRTVAPASSIPTQPSSLKTTTRRTAPRTVPQDLQIQH